MGPIFARTGDEIKSQEQNSAKWGGGESRETQVQIKLFFLTLVGARGRRPPWSPPWVPVTLGHCEVLYVLFFLIFYSLFGPCPSRTALPPALPCKTDGQTDPALPPAPPCLAARFSESDCPGRFHRVN